MAEEDVRRVAADLTPEQSAELEQVMVYHGLERTTEAIRFLIRKEARAIRDTAPLFAPSQHQEASV